MGLSWPWEDDCDDTIVIDNVTFKLIKGPTPGNNLVNGLYADWDCTYQAQDGSGRIVTETHHRVLWIFDF
jgi:hypothetical protein